MIRATEDGSLSIEKLEAMTSVCSVGLDMIAIPGDTPVEAIAGIIADEMAIGVINTKTTAVRLIPGDWPQGGRHAGVWRPLWQRAGHGREPLCRKRAGTSWRSLPRTAQQLEELGTRLLKGGTPPLDLLGDLICCLAGLHTSGQTTRCRLLRKASRRDRKGSAFKDASPAAESVLYGTFLRLVAV
jgi:hypothetical protein